MQRALFYELRVMSADGDLVWQARFDGTSGVAPPTVAFQPGQKYFASVSALVPEGNALKSRLAGFEIAQP